MANAASSRSPAEHLVAGAYTIVGLALLAFLFHDARGAAAIGSPREARLAPAG